ncbi:hypothetical protein WA026_009271 [Henosepilachna vigintioctopunctata]|uniref:Uncharacterized protein n=1 Tax=Henosepilachna vigintioctopunctata TaxID=420089 RepID=A0AAW1UX11_9CUCU
MQSLKCILLVLVIIFSSATAFLWDDDDCNYYCGDEGELGWVTGQICKIFCYDDPYTNTTGYIPYTTAIPCRFFKLCSV